MNPIYEAAIEVEACCRARGFSFCFIGGVAVQRWGHPRLTADVDLTVLTGFGAEERFVDALLTDLRGRIPDARAFALRHRALLLIAGNGIHVDASLGAMPFEERTMVRATPFTVDDAQRITTCCAEDLVVHKVFAGRDKDWLDVRGIVIRQGDKLDARVIWDELLPLLELKEDAESESKLRALLASG